MEVRKMARKIKLKSNPYQTKPVSPAFQMACPYCGSHSCNPLKIVETDGFQQYKCSSCLKTFGKRI